MSRSLPQQALIAAAMPPPLFAGVEPGVYRSAYPGPQHIAFLVQTVGIKTVLLLSIEDLQLPAKQLLTAVETPLSVARVTDAAWASKAEFCEGLVADAFNFIFDASCHPLLLTCPTGALQTSVVVGCLRRAQRWTFSSIVHDCGLFAKSGSVQDRLSAFIEQYAPPAMVPGIASVAARLRASYIVGGPIVAVDGAAALASPAALSLGASLASSGAPLSPGGSVTNRRSNGAAVERSPGLLATDVTPSGARASLENPLWEAAILAGAAVPGWWATYIELRDEEEALLQGDSSHGERIPQAPTISKGPPLPALEDKAAPSSKSDASVGTASALPIVTKDLKEAAERKALKRRLKGFIAHEVYRFCGNPPAVGPGVTFSVAESIVEEDDD